MAQNIFYSPWEGTKGPWLFLVTTLLLFDLLWLFSFVLSFLTSLIKLNSLAKIFHRQKAGRGHRMEARIIGSCSALLLLNMWRFFSTPSNSLWYHTGILQCYPLLILSTWRLPEGSIRCHKLGLNPLRLLPPHFICHFQVMKVKIEVVPTTFVWLGTHLRFFWLYHQIH